MLKIKNAFYLMGAITLSFFPEQQIAENSAKLLFEKHFRKF